ncbi:MAG TPA: hypothetical protein VKK79_12310 [Candidatus Lokiarchaeia archaeon]|nr:hypothetical protein [Candidatus Lokiarchaeia archaeon]
MFQAVFQADIARNFQYDYIFFDAMFLVLFLTVVIKNKKWNPLKAGLVTAALVYFIDAVIWWNTPSGIPDANIRQYWIYNCAGVALVPGTPEFALAKFGADFMMTISYSLFAFTWAWIMFESWSTRNTRDMVLYTSLLFGSWMIEPFLSKYIPWCDGMVTAVRHMSTQIPAQLCAVIGGYVLMTALYWKSDKKVILYVFFIGCFQGFAMEFLLWVSGIRPTGIYVLIYETIVLCNEGIPYLYIVWNKIIPWLSLRYGKNRNILQAAKEE